MVTSISRELYSRIYICFVLGLLLSLITCAVAQAQTATYRLHRETSTTQNHFQLKTDNPDAASFSVQSANLKNVANGEKIIAEFDTQSNVPNVAGTLTAGSTISVEVWMRKTATAGTMFPRVKINLNSSGGASVGVITGSTQLSTTITKYTLTGTVPANVSISTSDRFYLWVGVNLTAGTSVNNRAELNVEGTVNGNYDSRMTVPLPNPVPSISNLSPNNGPIGTSVTITGTNFNATQGTSTVTFNGVSATPTNWSATSISVPVPSGATTGPVVVTVNSQASNGATFTVKPKIDNLSPTSGPSSTPVTITGTTFGSSQGTSTVTFNGTAATPTSWSATSISAPVPSGATTGPVVVTVNSQASNGVTFTVNTAGSITGTITRASDSAAINGALIEAMQSGSVVAFTSSAANGSYTISSLNAGTYDVRVSAVGYQTVMETGVVVTTGNSTTVNKSLVAVSGNDITYIYDERSRLVAVVTSSEVATYSYDEVGNLTGITRGNAALVSVIEFTPNGGIVGTPVTIYGTGFSVTPGQNTVKFNGVTAAVTSSTATEIVTSVPAGATTGPISVTSPAGHASSSTSFVIGEPEAPTITGFTPTIGTAGTAVTITGTNFDPSFQNDKTKFSLTNAETTAATSTTIDTKVPSGANSGHITVSTPAGSATSSGDFFIPPSPYTAADVAVTGRMAIGENKVVTINTANKIGIILFDGAAGDRVSLGMTGVTIGSPTWGTLVSIRDPFGAILLANFGVGTDGGGTDTLTLPVDGTYSIIVDPVDALTGNMTLLLSADLVVPITIDGSPINLSFTRPGQNARLTFNGTAGQQVSIGASGSNIGFSNWGTYVSVKNPDGSTLLAPMDVGTDGTGSNTLALPVTGTYSILVDPRSAMLGNITITLSSEVNLPITIDGSAVSLSFTRVGQNARLTFSGTAGQQVSIGASGSNIGFSNWGTWLSAKNPDGSTLLAVADVGSDGYGSNTLSLPATGTYSILVDPRNAMIGNITITLSAEVNLPIVVDGSAISLSFTRPGQNARLTFDGTAGQQVTIGGSSSTIGFSNWGTWLSAKNPDGSTLLAVTDVGSDGYGSNTLTLPSTGTYSILVDPRNAMIGNITITLSAEVNLPIVIDGSAVNLSFTRPGQNARLTFSGTAGQQVSIGASGSNIGFSNWGTWLSAKNPDGSTLLAVADVGSDGYGSNTLTLPSTGTYSILVDPRNSFTGNITITLSSEVNLPITIDGSSINLSFTRPGQNARLTFSGTAGQQVSIGGSASTIGFSNWGTWLSAKNPDGSALLAVTDVGSDGYGSNTLTLPATGNYSIIVDPRLSMTGNITITLSSEVTLPITIDGSSVSLAFTRPGQNARLTFSGTAGQQVSIGTSASTIGFSNWGVYLSARNPDGSTLVSQVDVGTDGYSSNTLALPSTGTYSIFIDPRLSMTGNITVTLSSEVVLPITIDGSAVSVSLTRPGQNARFTFSGTASQQVSFGMGPSTIGFSNWGTNVSARNPDGSTLVSIVDVGTDGYSSNTLTLASTGTYSIIADPRLSYTGNITATLSTELTGSISIDGPAADLTLRAGQNAKVTFTANAGQQARLKLANVTIGLSNWGTFVTIKNPDGSTLLSTVEIGTAGFETSYLTMPATGTYSILLDPRLAFSGGISTSLISLPPPPQAVSSPNSNDVVWFDDSLPAGAQTGGDSETWTWVSSNPTAISGSSSHQSNIVSGMHQHYFDNATTTMAVNTGDKLIVYVYLDPSNMPSEVMVQWNDGDWEHRAYWGANNIGWGTNNTNSRRYMGPLPATGGQWYRFVIPASEVGLEGRTIKGMAFTLHGGRATWDRAAKATQ